MVLFSFDKNKRAALKHTARREKQSKRRAERAARREAKKASADCGPGCCGGIGTAISSGITLLIVVNLVLVWVAGFTGNWLIYEIGWPIQLFLMSMALCMVMMAAGSIWLLIPIGIIFGNGILFTYYALTWNWDHWDFLWPLEPLLVIVAVWVTIVLSGRGRFSCRMSRFFGLVLWLISAGMVAMTLMSVWPWFYDGALQLYNSGADVWPGIQ